MCAEGARQRRLKSSVGGQFNYLFHNQLFPSMHRGRITREYGVDPRSPGAWRDSFDSTPHHFRSMIRFPINIDENRRRRARDGCFRAATADNSKPPSRFSVGNEPRVCASRNARLKSDTSLVPFTGRASLSLAPLTHRVTDTFARPFFLALLHIKDHLRDQLEILSSPLILETDSGLRCLLSAAACVLGVLSCGLCFTRATHRFSVTFALLC